jgi:D-alanyl-D-alanine carboxypeptidase (penicillin-binding protein 5/6)
MQEKFRVQSSKFKVQKGNILLIIFFMLCTLHALHFVSYAAEISSKAAVVMEASTGRVLYGKNPNLKLLPASTTKLMTAMIVLDQISPADTATISERAAGVSAVKANFKVGEKVSVETLLNAALIKSANDAAFALAEAVAGSEDRFVELMNQKVIALGMSDTHFVNSTGLPGHGQHTTAYDLARMLRHALRYPLVREIINTKASRISTEDGRSIFIKNSNRLLWADETVLGGKTGYTREAKHCFVCASEQGNETVIAALLGAPSRETLWKESEVLIEKGFAIMSGKEEPVMYFTRSDYKASVQHASYNAKTSEVKETPNKKVQKKVAKKKTKARSGKYAKKQRTKENTKVEAKGFDGDKG